MDKETQQKSKMCKRCDMGLKHCNNNYNNCKYRDKFTVGITGLSEDMEDFILEQDVYYTEHVTKFWTSFWKTCSEMWSIGCDLSDKQLAIIEREYNKVKEERMKDG